MPVPTDITAGTLTITNGSTAVTGVGTSWLASDLRQGDVILWIEGGDGFQTPILADVPATNTALTLVEPWEGPTLTDMRYRIRYQWDSSRVSAQSRQLIELLDNGNLLALSGLTGPGVPVFNGPHSMEIRPTQDFINGVAYDVQVDTLTDRAAYDGQAVGFSVLVSDVGDGRSAIYSKASNTSADWTDPAYVTGPVGPAPTFEAGTASRGPLNVTLAPVTGGYELNLTIPTQTAMGDYSGATAYVTGDFVQNAGSSWVALQNTTGNAPPTFPTTSNTYWQLLARAGNDGAGTVTTLAEGTGIDVDSTDPTMPVVSLANVPTTTVKGRVAGGTGSPTDLTGTQVNTILPVFGSDKGLVPGATTEDVDEGRVLSASGTWVEAGSSASSVNQKIVELISSDLVQKPLQLQNAFADAWFSSDYIDEAGSAGADFSIPGVVKPIAPFSGTVASAPGTGASPGFVNHTAVVVIEAAQVLQTGTGTVTVTFKAGTSGGFDVALAYIGHGATTGDVYDFDATPTQLFFSGGSPSGSAATNGTVTASADFTIQPGKRLLIAWQSGTNGVPSDGAATGWTAYWKNVTGEVANINKTAYSYVAYPLAVSNISLTSVGGDITAYFGPFAVGAGVEEVTPLLRIKEIDVATINTDYSVRISRDGRASWVNAPLTELFVSQNPVNGTIIATSEDVDLSAQPDNEDIWIEISTANGKEIEFRGLAFDYKGGEPP